MKSLRIGFITLLGVILTSCSAQSQEPFTQLNMEDVDETVQDFVERVEDNGVYLFGNHLDADQYYVLLDGVDRKENKQHTFFKDVYAEIQNETLHIFFSETNASESGQNQLLFKIDKTKFPEDYHNIKLFKDNQTTDFTSIMVQGETP